MTIEEFIRSVEPWRKGNPSHDAHCINHPNKSTLNFGPTYVCWQCKDKERKEV